MFSAHFIVVNQFFLSRPQTLISQKNYICEKFSEVYNINNSSNHFISSLRYLLYNKLLNINSFLNIQ